MPQSHLFRQSLWSQLTTIDRAQIHPIVALRNSAGVAIAVVAGGWLPTGGHIALVLGAMLVANSDRSDSYRHRAARMLWASFLCALAVSVAGVCAQVFALQAAVAVAAAFLTGITVVLEQSIADLAVISMVSYIIFATSAMTGAQAAEEGFFVFLGGLIQTGLSVALWPARRYRPEQRALGHLFHSLVGLAEHNADPEAVPAASDVSDSAQVALASIARDPRAEGGRYRSLLNQSERIRLNLISLGHLRRRLGPHDIRLDPFLALADEALEGLSQGLIHGDGSGFAPEVNAKMACWISQTQDRASQTEDGFLKATLGDTLYRAQKLAGQLRAANVLARETTTQGRVAVEVREKELPWRLRFGGIRATLQANLRPDTMAFRHAVRLAACILVSELIVGSTHMVRPFWIPMTVVLVLRPEFTLTTSRSILRIAGTVVGLVISTALLSFLPPAHYTSLGLITLFTFGLRWLGPSHYGILSLCVSGQVVVLLSMLYPDLPASVLVVARALNTLYGGSIALLAYWLWPTREKGLVTDLLADLLDRYRAYSQAFLAGADARQVDGLRLLSRQTRGRFRASCERFFVESGTTDEQRGELSAMMASSNRVAHALIGIETVRLPEASLYRDYARELSATLEGLAESLRSGQLEVDHHLQLRELHTRMRQGSEPSSFLEETDRLTNSLGTLSEQIARRLRNEKRLAISREPSS